MQENARAKRYFGLKIARTILKVLTFLGAITFIVILVVGVVILIRDPQSEVPNALPRINLLWVLAFYVMYQIIDVVLSINDNLRSMKNQAVDELERTNRMLEAQNRKLIALIEQHHRRLENLEKERQP